MEVEVEVEVEEGGGMEITSEEWMEEVVERDIRVRPKPGDLWIKNRCCE